MFVVAVSGANIQHQPEGISVRLAQTTIDILKEEVPGAEGCVVSLVNKRIEPCIGCGNCIGSGQCILDDDFSSVYDNLIRADGLVFVSPHYAPIPAKLCALLERVESISFLNTWNNPDWKSPLKDKPCALIGHGGAAGEDAQRFYYDVVLVPLKNALGYPVQAKVVSVPVWPHIGVVTGPIRVREGGRFPIQEYDWDELATKLTTLTRAMIGEIVSRTT